MYENFVIATQSDTYLLLEKEQDAIYALKFDSKVVKYGSPNDEGRGAHPLAKYGKLIYGFYEVNNSPWIKEQMVGNRCHDRHKDSFFDNYKHYIACFKDVMFEITCTTYEEIQLSGSDISKLITKQLGYLQD